MLHTARPTIVYLLVPMLLLLFMPIPGSSSDAQGNYVALGFGLESCQTFLQARSNSLDLPYRHWLTGYLTAVNKLTKIPWICEAPPILMACCGCLNTTVFNIDSTPLVEQ